MADTIYMRSLKHLLGVRQTTCNESGAPPVRAFILRRMSKYLSKLIRRDDFESSYIGKVVNLAVTSRSPAGLIIDHLLHQPFQLDEHFTQLKDSVRTSPSTRRCTYSNMNPSLDVPSPYQQDMKIPEMHRKAFTRKCLSSHRLKIETGRWARVPREQRLCQCEADVQSEEHVLLQCPLTARLRHDLSVPNIDFVSLMNTADTAVVAELCFRVLNQFEN